MKTIKEKIKENIENIICIVIASAVILLMFFAIFTSCADSEREKEKCLQEQNISSEKFTVITGSDIYIDPETGVNYIHFLKGGVCVRVKEDGTPYVTDINKLKNEVSANEK